MTALKKSITKKKFENLLFFQLDNYSFKYPMGRMEDDVAMKNRRVHFPKLPGVSCSFLSPQNEEKKLDFSYNLE